MNKPIKYLGWEVTQLRQGSWRATKGELSINCSSAHLIKELIKEDNAKTNLREVKK